MGIAISKALGTACASFVFINKVSVELQICMIGILVIDLVYIIMVYRMRYILNSKSHIIA